MTLLLLWACVLPPECTDSCRGVCCRPWGGWALGLPICMLREVMHKIGVPWDQSRTLHLQLGRVACPPPHLRR